MIPMSAGLTDLIGLTRRLLVLMVVISDAMRWESWKNPKSRTRKQDLKTVAIEDMLIKIIHKNRIFDGYISAM